MRQGKVCGMKFKFELAVRLVTKSIFKMFLMVQSQFC